MKKTTAEKTGVVIMFILVLVVFSFAERDTKKIIQQQTRSADVQQVPKDLTGESTPEKPISQLYTRK